METVDNISVKAHVKHVRIAPRKVRAVLNLIRGKDVIKAKAILMHTQRGAGETIKKLLDSAIANGEENNHLDRDDLFVAECYANEGVTLKRMRPRAFGRGARINKRTSHITIVLKEKEESEERE